MKRPMCKCCGKPIPKRTQRISVPREPSKMHPIFGWRYTGNMIVASRQYTPLVRDNGKKRLDSITVWDGESYFPRYKFFCSIKCAALFGQRAVQGGEA